jgi:predicted RNase H-like nuclease (RuvC/YqgF family)
MSYQNPLEARFYIDQIVNDSVQNYKNENQQMMDKIKELESTILKLQTENKILSDQIYYAPGNQGYIECEKRFNELKLNS